jgi:hypothetical protein
MTAGSAALTAPIRLAACTHSRTGRVEHGSHALSRRRPIACQHPLKIPIPPALLRGTSYLRWGCVAHRAHIARVVRWQPKYVSKTFRAAKTASTHSWRPHVPITLVDARFSCVGREIVKFNRCRPEDGAVAVQSASAPRNRTDRRPRSAGAGDRLSPLFPDASSTLGSAPALPRANCVRWIARRASIARKFTRHRARGHHGQGRGAVDAA